MGIAKMSPDVHQLTAREKQGLILTQYKYLFSDELGELPVTYDSGSQHTACNPASPLHPCHDAGMS